MKHLLQNLSSGNTSIVNAPDPTVDKNSIIVAASCSLISVGTERMLVDFGKASLLNKARQQPEKVKMALEKVHSDGLLPTIEAVRTKLDQPISLGYSSVGVVSEVGKNVSGVAVGDRVISNGPHASVVKTTENLCARIPDNVDDASAAFTVVSSIALQGIRLSKPTLGESFVVVGVGLIGLIAVQILRAHGCRVMAIDIDERKLALAKKFGAEVCNSLSGVDPVASGMTFSNGLGVDGVIITASTKSNDPVTQAARMSRKRGRIVLVGVTGLELNRADFYEKELTFQVSCSYGPGRYDENYEAKGHDYPIGFVRWTEQRNFESVLVLMAEGKLNVQPLITHRFEFEDAERAYTELSKDKSALGILLEYPSSELTTKVNTVRLNNNQAIASDTFTLGCMGAGNYASRVLIPAFKKSGASLHSVVTAGGISGAVTGEKAGFEFASSDVASIMQNEDINGIVIATRHDSHAELVVAGLEAGKHVFVEKPLCLTLEELESIETAHERSGRILMIGFNRRFAPLIQRMRQLLENVLEPKSFVMTVNAGDIPSNHWAQDAEIGGGRLIGEACHFVDLLRYLADAPVQHSSIVKLDSETSDTLSINLKFSNGSIGTVHYFANGSKKFPKERLEIFSGSKILQMDNYRELRSYDWPGLKKLKSYSQDKGQLACVNEFVRAVTGGSESPISIDEIFEVSRICINLENQ